MTLLRDSLPWKRNRTQILDRNAVEFADVAGYGGIIDDEERAKLIVRAVNNHEALVQLVKKLSEDCRNEDLYADSQKLLASLE